MLTRCIGSTVRRMTPFVAVPSEATCFSLADEESLFDVEIRPV
jgi:hypothetical protein